MVMNREKTIEAQLVGMIPSSFTLLSMNIRLLLIRNRKNRVRHFFAYKNMQS